jgi:hypothetical protein
MAEVVLSTDELQILSGPSEIKLEVDFGPEGNRGSLIFASLGNPNTTLVGQTVQAKDLCVNILETDDNYSYIYQYNATSGGSYQWVPLIKLSPFGYKDNVSGTFVDGEKKFNIPVLNVVDLETSQNLTNANFNVQFNILNSNPVASSITLGSLITDPTSQIYVLPITVKAIEYSGSSWTALSGTKTVQFAISIVV